MIAVGMVAAMAVGAVAQVVAPAHEDGPAKREAMAPPELAPALKSLLDQPYLSDEEKRALRVSHGLWETGDLASAALAAEAALDRGDFLDPALADAGVSAVLRGDALWRKGDPARALEVLKDEKSIRAGRVRAECLVDLGRPAEAMKEIEGFAPRVGASTNADEVVEGVRGLLLYTRLAGASKAGSEYQQMLQALAHAHDDLDRLSWRAPLAEAALLESKNKYPEMGQAIVATLALDPRCAEAWLIAGRAAADTFDFERAESIALRLDELAAPRVSAYAAIVRALTQLKQNEGEEAEKALRPALELYPNQRELRAVWVAAAAGRFDFDEAKRRLDAFDVLSPGSPRAYTAAGSAMASARQYDEAAAYLREAVTRAPNDPEPLIELGLSEMQSGRNDAALDALSRAGEMDTFNARATNSLTLLRELSTYTASESEHFVVRCKPGVDEVLAKEMLPQLELIYARVTGNGPGGVDHQPKGKTVVELYPDHRWFGVRITGLPQLHTIAAATGPVIAMEAPRDGRGHFGSYNWARVVQHEYTHTVTLSRTKNRLPHWFTEAGAVYLEDSPRDTQTVELLAKAFRADALFDFDTINVMFVRPKKQTDRQQAYAQGHWMYEFIIERYGMSKPLELMDLYAKGVREEAAFRQVLGVGREEFLRDFTAYAHDQLVSWGMMPTETTPDLRELWKREKVEQAVRSKETGANDEPAEESSAAIPKEPTPELLTKWLAANPDNPFVLAGVMRVRMAAHDGKARAEDIDLLTRYATARPMDALPHRLLAELFLSGEAGDGHTARDAIEHLEYLDAREQHSGAYAMELSRQYAAAGDLEKASAKAERATQISPYEAGPREYAAGIALRRKDYAAAERHIRALIVLEPDRPVHKQRLEALERLKAGK